MINLLRGTDIVDRMIAITLSLKQFGNQIICHQNPAAINVVLLFRNFALSNRELISV